MVIWRRCSGKRLSLALVEEQGSYKIIHREFLRKEQQWIDTALHTGFLGYIDASKVFMDEVISAECRGYRFPEIYHRKKPPRKRVSKRDQLAALMAC